MLGPGFRAGKRLEWKRAPTATKANSLRFSDCGPSRQPFSEFFKRLNANWQRSYGIALLAIRCTLIATFIAVVVRRSGRSVDPSRITGRVLPDPGGQCRQGYAQLLTMAVCNVVTDLLLVFFPIPIILQSQMSVEAQNPAGPALSLSLGVVAITLYRVPLIIWDPRQSTEPIPSTPQSSSSSPPRPPTFWCWDPLFATAALKAEIQAYGSVAAGSMERSSGSYTRRPTAIRHWGSDEDLVRDVGFGVDRELQNDPLSPRHPRAMSYTPSRPGS